MATREDIIIPLKCCQSSDSMTSVSTADNETICEAKNNYIVTPVKKTVDNFDNNNKYSLMGQNGKKKHYFPKRIPVDLQFNNITYTAKQWSMTRFKLEQKTILHGVSGEFKSGNLSVIMGPSGAGKSTLLNILAGYIVSGSSGEIRLNDTIRDDSPRFRKLVAYIPQDEELRLSLTSKEAMMFAAHLKLGYSVSTEYKIEQVVEILELLGLEECHHTMTSRLSGGQRKRLAVALELLSNPPILFLDEPTTGLDSSSCTQCVSLFKRLAKEGRTIVCTIHQPSALLFEMFDNLYALSEGKCIYNGSISSLVPDLAKLGLQCPSYHNPADFLMEVAIGEYGSNMDILAEAAKNTYSKKLSENVKEKESMSASKHTRPSVDEAVPTLPPTPAATIMQFLLLYRRNLLQTKRSYMFLFNRLLVHIFIGFVFGYLYRGVGTGADTVLGNYVYLYGSVLLLVYTGMMAVTLTFPMEMKILNREHFNRWYKLSPYLLSVILIEIPFQILCSLAYILISYWLTEQPHDFRVYLFILFCALSSLCAQSWGYFIGATTPIKIAVFIAPVLACFFSVFGFCLRYFDTPYIFKWLHYVSYYRAGFHGVVYSIYGLNRDDLICPEQEFYCHYIEPNKFLKEMDIVDVDLVTNISIIVVIWCIMHAATYLALWLRLHKR